MAFANELEMSLASDLLERQVQYDRYRGKGIEKELGANIGLPLLKNHNNDIRIEARAWAAAGSDARMSECGLPAGIVSGSADQGMSVSWPEREVVWTGPFSSS